MSNQSVAEKWRDALKNAGYEHGNLSKNELEKLGKFSRVWRRIFKFTDLKINSKIGVFEAGCGGAKHLVPFALRGVRCVGLDFSPEVLKRAEHFVSEAGKLYGRKINLTLIEGDFLNYKSADSDSYDLVFHSGVIEHFLEDVDRLNFLKNMFSLAKSGGYVVSIVPSGTHPIREKMKRLKLGGYGIPEIDYTPALMKSEFSRLAACDIKILPHNLFGYLLIDDLRGARKIIGRLFFYFFQIIPVSLLPYNFAVRHAGTLIGIAKKD